MDTDTQEMQSFVYAAYKRCRARRSEAEDIDRIAEAEAERAERRRIAAKRKEVEKVRARDNWFKSMVENAVESYKTNRAQGLVEMRIVPGPRWTPEWWDRVCRHRLPNFVPEALPENMGATAILFALDRLEDRIRSGRRVIDNAGYVYKEARCVMLGQRTAWVSPSVAAENPDCIVTDWRFSYAGKMWVLYQARIKRVYKDPEEQQKRGLDPFPSSGVTP